MNLRTVVVAFAGALVAAAAAVPSDASAQRVVGRVVDSAGAGIRDVTLHFRGGGRTDSLTTVSDSTGGFGALLPGVGIYRITAERIGYAMAGPKEFRTIEGEEVELLVRMGTSAIALPGVEVVASRRVRIGTQQIYDRIARMRQLGIGRALTRPDIERLTAQSVGSMVGTMSGRLRIVESQQLIVNTIFVRDGTKPGGQCAPAVYIDGFRVNQRPTNVNMLIEPRHVEAVELYVGAAQTPLGFHDPAGCGSLLIWSRRGSATEGKPNTWVRWAVAAVLGVGLWFVVR